MPNILLTRIDNRLIHGQVGVTWTKTLGANLLLVANDAVANDPMQQKMMAVTAKSSGAGFRFFSLEKTAAIISKAAPERKIFIICKTPADVRYLVEHGVPIKDLNVGNMHFSKGQRAISKNVYVDDSDYADLKAIEAADVNVFIQDVPGDEKLKIEQFKKGENAL